MSGGDLTKGPVAKRILLFALPFLGSSLIQQLYNCVDLIFVGRLLGTEASAAVGAGSLLITCMLGLFTGIGVGVGIAAAHAFGGGDRERLKRVIHSAAAMCVLGSAVLTAVGVLLAPTFLRWLCTPEVILEKACVYMRIYFASLLSVVSYNMASGVLRALGDSGSPMLYQLIGGLTNVAANAFFLVVLRMGVAGVALATLCSQSVAALLMVHRVCRLDPDYRLRLGAIRLHRDVCGEILRVGIPSAVQAMVITLSNLIVQAAINSLGVEEIAAFTAYFRVELFVYLPIMAIGQANATFAGQNFGADRQDRVRSGVRVSLGTGISLAAVLSAVLIVFSSGFFSLFSGAGDVIAIGGELARTTFPFYFLYVPMEVFSGTIRGAGKALVPMLITVGCMCGVRLAALRIMLGLCPTAAGVARVYPITWAAAALSLGLYYRFGRWRPGTARQG